MMNDTLSWAKKLIECPSITPNDVGCQALIADSLSQLGFSIQNLPFEDVQNLWARKGNSGSLFVYAGHTDVVPPGPLAHWQSDPFNPIEHDGFLWGRGAADMKGSIAAMLTAAERFFLKHPNPKNSFAFLLTSDEEGRAEHGTKKVIEHLTNKNIHIDYCLIGEPTSKDRLGDTLKIGRRGSLSGKLKIIGQQGHVAYPHKALNPIHHAFSSLLELTQTKWDEGGQGFPETTFQISNIQSGTGAENVIPGILECLFNFRFNTLQEPELLQTFVENLLTKNTKNYGINYEIDWVLHGKPYLSNPDLSNPGHLLSVIQKSIQKETGIEVIASTDGGGSDGRFIATTGAEVVEFGPCNATIHCVNERVSIADLEALSKIYEKILEKMLL